MPGSSSSRTATCYNCGSNDHFMMACPEPVRPHPAGLVAARAAETGHQQSPPSQHGAQEEQDQRPYKRHKYGTVGKRFASTAVVTRFAPPPNVTPAYRAREGYFTAPYQPQVPASSYVPPDPNQSQKFGPTPYASPVGYQAHSQTGQPYSQPPYTSGQTYGPHAAYEGPQAYGYSQSASQQYGYSAPIQHYKYQPPHAPYYQHTNYPAAGGPVSYGYNTLSQQFGAQEEYTQNSHWSPQYAPNPVQQYQPHQAFTYQASLPMTGHQETNQWIPPTTAPTPYAAQPYQQSYTPQYNQNSGQQQHHGISRQRGGSHYQQNRRGSQYLRSEMQRRRQSYDQKTINPRVETTPAFPSSNQKPANITNDGLFMENQNSSRSSSMLEGRKASVEGSDQEQPPASNEENQQSRSDWDSEKIFIDAKTKPTISTKRPLPMCFTEDLAIPDANSQPSLALNSKYVRTGNMEVFKLPIEKTLHWATLQLEPVFKPIKSNSTPIPLAHPNTWSSGCHKKLLDASNKVNGDRQSTPPHKRTRSEYEEDDNDEDIKHEVLRKQELLPSNPAPLSNLNSLYGTSNEPDVQVSVTPTLEQPVTPTFAREGTPSYYNQDDVWVPQPGEGKSTASIEENPTEALLASLGVSGTPKPVEHNIVDFPTTLLEDYLSHQSEQNPGNWGSNRGDPKHDGWIEPQRQDSGYVSARGSYSNTVQPTSMYPTHNNIHQIQWAGHPPPPPPPPRHKRGHYDGTFSSPSSDDSADDVAQPQTTHGEYGKVCFASDETAHEDSSPLKTGLANLMGEENTGSVKSESLRKPDLRQVDDVTPKLKRRQPKVDAAYSRRW